LGVRGRDAPAKADTRQRPPPLGAALFLASGAALLSYILSGISLQLTLAVAVMAAVGTGAALWRRATAPQRAAWRRTVTAGLLAGVAATAAYDLSRYVLVEVAGLGFSPFDVFGLFGRALTGAHHASGWVIAAGAGFHVLNGVGFGTAYTLWLGRRGPAAGIVFAMVLETIMVSVYPGWLGLKALDEFVPVSVVGHLCYGFVLGSVARQLLVGRLDHAPA
jgi:hypothetical protein